MMVTLLKSKIHRAVVTEANLTYEGSLTLDPYLMEAAGILAHERVLVANISNGERIETYIIEGKRDSGTVCLNGAAARLGQPGDLVIVMTFAIMDEEEARHFRPKIVYVNALNHVIRVDI